MKKNISGHSMASLRLLLVWSRRCGPFVDMVWAALASPDCRWNSSTVGASRGQLFCHRSVPLGFKPVAWCATPLTKNDLRKFRASIGASQHNTSWEALALLVAVRLWLPGGAGLGARQVWFIVSGQERGFGSPAGPSASALHGRWPWTPSWACTLAGSRLTPRVYPTDNPMICHRPLSRTVHRSLLSACHGIRVQIGIVGSGRPPLQSTGAGLWQVSSHRRGTGTSRASRAFLLVVALLTLCVVGPAGHPSPRTACQPGTRGFTACLCGL